MTMIEARGIGKEFVIRGTGAPVYGTLRESFAAAGRRLLGRDKPDTHASPARRFWALRDVSFDIDQGEVVGIVGRNGAGKSTLLKILARITAPTMGRATLHGRVGSLLEVGTGFHPELSGRDNVYLNGAILGLRRRTIDRLFDEIVDFAGVGDFLEMPIKRYSTGMQMRLAFAVAAHLDPEIMIVDEVLAVGDADFQRKCLGKIGDVARSGRTVLFVSHSTNSISQLCSRVIWLERGTMRDDSRDVRKVLSRYLLADGVIHGAFEPGGQLAANPYFRLVSLKHVDANRAVVDHPVTNDEPRRFEITIDLQRLHAALYFGIAILNEEGQHVLWSASTDLPERDWPAVHLGLNRLVVEVPARLLNEGTYRVDFIASIHNQTWLSEPGNTECSIQMRIAGGLSDSPYWRGRRPGLIAPVLNWVLGD